jgi:TPR repeat protein
MKLGNVSSILKFGDCSVKGKGVSKNKSKSFKYYRKSMKTGCNCLCSILHEIGIGVKQNSTKAIKLPEKTTLSNVPNAINYFHSLLYS